MIPIIPHFANECLKNFDIKSIKWPVYDDTLLIENIIQYVVQINGKKRAILNTIKDMYGEDNYNNRRFGMASEMFMEMITGEVLDEFLTLPAYRHI